MNYKRICTAFLLLLILVSINSYSQDNHNYQTPVGKSLFVRDVQDANRTILSMNEIQPLSSGQDGLMVAFTVQADLSQVTKPLKLLSFTMDTEANSYLDIFYQGETIMFRRKFAPGSPYYYDYDLYDPMFSEEVGVTTWEVKVFFTGYFFWIETRNTRKVTENKWHAPVFFGINLPGTDYMAKYLSRDASAKLVFGDNNPSATFTMPEEIAVYEFKYTALKDELQANFCND